ncbi:MAG: transposase family protein [Sporichthyaceae bacterium]|nr:transposase family protein [Sporichthyaceae bacterium]
MSADEQAAACPSCGVFSTSVNGHVTTAPKDLPYGEDPLEVRWHKRRWRCAEARCARHSFTESIGEVPAGRRTTLRLRRSCVAAVVENQCVDEVARAHGVSWPTVQRAVDDHARACLGEPGPTPAFRGIQRLDAVQPAKREREHAPDRRGSSLLPLPRGCREPASRPTRLCRCVRSRLRPAADNGGQPVAGRSAARRLGSAL